MGVGSSSSAAGGAEGVTIAMLPAAQRNSTQYHCEKCPRRCLHELILTLHQLGALLGVIQGSMRRKTPHTFVTLKGGGAFCWHLWQDPNTIARFLRFGCVGRIRDIDLELDVQPAAQNYDEVAIVAALCDAVDCLNSHFAPMVLASIRLPTTFRIVHSPPVCTRHWVGPEHVWCHGHRRGPIVVIRRGTCHGNTKNFELWRIALAVADANGRIHYLPFIDISYHPMAANGAMQPAARDCQLLEANHGKFNGQCDAIALRVLQSDLRRMLVQESNLRPWLRVDSGKTQARICRLLAVALMLDEARGRSETLLLELVELEEWITDVLQYVDLDFDQCDHCRPCGLRTNTARQIIAFVSLMQEVPMRPEHHQLSESFVREERALCVFAAHPHPHVKDCSGSASKTFRSSCRRLFWVCFRF